MNISDLLKDETAGITLAVSANDLKIFAESIINRFVRVWQAERKNEQKEEVLLTRKEVCKKYNISSCTLWRWNKNELLKSVHFGGKILYRQSDVENFLKKGGINE